MNQSRVIATIATQFNVISYHIPKDVKNIPDFGLVNYNYEVKYNYWHIHTKMVIWSSLKPKKELDRPVQMQLYHEKTREIMISRRLL